VHSPPREGGAQQLAQLALHADDLAAKLAADEAIAVRIDDGRTATEAVDLDGSGASEGSASGCSLSLN
jgi:hypothetical protein